MRFWAIKTQYHCEITSACPCAIYERIINYVKHSFSMMFIILTHDNQSTLSSFSLFLSFATNSPVAEKALSGWALLYSKWLQASDFLWLLTSSNWICMIKNILKVSSKKAKYFVETYCITNWKGMNRVCKESQLLNELTHNSSWIN